MFEAVSVRRRKMRMGSSGAGERSSITRNPTTRAAEAARSPIVSVVAQPCWLACVSAYTSSIRPPVIDAAPAVSKWRWSRSARLSFSSSGLITSTTTPTGTLMKKIQDQLSALVSAPPSRTPAAPPLPEAAPQIPRATLRSRPSLNVVVRIESAAGASSAAPSPCRPRKAIREPDDQARPLSREKTVNTAMPAMKMRLRPSRSAIRPPSSRTPPNTIA